MGSVLAKEIPQTFPEGNSLKDGYPCLFSTEEVEHGVPLTGDHLYDHNYCKKEDIAEIVENPVVAQEHPVDHIYSRLATNPPESSFLNTGHTCASSSGSQMTEGMEIDQDPSISILKTESTDLICSVKRTHLKNKAPIKIVIGGGGKSF
ncbi:unnamed protein product [Parnassius apollo]|uniref:(apollo) hypothetical protein n=1 Tax=Parnassius apollo TaxID=110799 RepID=A0A8S3XJS9_PARAO|nr:unnamed protein product [Parnassius apollo]